MRLTLRALLAWMDENLPPNDAELIAQKVAESELATNLKNQIQNVLSIPYLPASIVLDSTPMGDPNTAAEYLDNFMPSDDVVEYEKHCIHSDIVLAEVASCHQILTMVLGEPAEVDAEVRRRVYDMHDKYFAAYDEGTATPSVAEVMNELTHEISSAALTDGEKRGSGMTLILRALALAAVLLVAFWGVGRLYPDSKLGQLAVKMLPFAATAPVENEEGDEDAANGETVEVPIVQPPVKPVEPAVPVAPPVADPVTPDPVVEPDPTYNPAAADFTNGGEESPVAPVDAGEEEPPGVTVVRPGGKPVETPENGGNGASTTEAVAVTPPSVEPSPKRVPPPKRVGKLESPATQVLAEYNAREGAWGRLAPQAGVMTGSTLVSFSCYRPVVSVANQLVVTFVGASQLRVDQAESSEAPVLAVEYGRFLFETDEAEDGEFPGTVLATFPGYAGRLCFAQENTCVAVEVHRPKRFAASPESEDVPVNIHVHVVRGTVVVQPFSGAEPVAIKAGSFVRLVDEAQLDPVLRAAPVWVDPEEMDSTQQIAADSLAKGLNVGPRIERELMELTEGRNKEVVWLAARSLGQLGNFARMVSALNKQEESKNWSKYVDELREALARGTGQSADVLRSFELYSPQSKRAYRLLWAYQPPRMPESDAQELISALNEEDISVRILASWNLQRFYKGERPINYKPEQPAAQRAPGIQRWKEYVEQNPDIFVGE